MSHTICPQAIFSEEVAPELDGELRSKWPTFLNQAPVSNFVFKLRAVEIDASTLRGDRSNCVISHLARLFVQCVENRQKTDRNPIAHRLRECLRGSRNSSRAEKKSKV